MTTIQQQHKQLVATSFKHIDGRGGQQELLHAILGLAGEVGELVDAIKKHVFYEKPLDIENVVEELGDIEYYLEAFRQNIDGAQFIPGFGREFTLERNLFKLRKRYPGEVFSNQKAVERADKNLLQTTLADIRKEVEAHGNIVATHHDALSCTTDVKFADSTIKTFKTFSFTPGSPEWYEFQHAINVERNNKGPL